MQSFLKWKQTRQGLLISGVIEAVLAYGFASWAIDSGSAWHYLLTVVFLAGTIVSFVKAFTNHAEK